MDELADVERAVHRRLTEMLRASERMSFSRREDKEITKVNELIKVRMGAAMFVPSIRNLDWEVSADWQTAKLEGLCDHLQFFA